jgi:precorrin-6B methylase 2
MLVKELLLSYYKTQCLYAVAQLNIAELLKDAPLSIDALAAQLNVIENKLYRLMRFCASVGLFDEVEEKIFSLNKESQYLLASNEYSLLDFINLHGGYFYASAQELLNSLSTDDSSFELTYQMPAHQYFTQNPEVGSIYNTAMKENTTFYGAKILEAYNFKSYKLIIDIGGGVGALVASVLNKYPNIKAISFDIPQLEASSNKFIQEQVLEQRCQFVAGSFFEVIPEGGDLYIMKAILHGKDDKMASQILKNIHSVLQNHAKLIIIDRVIDKENYYMDACINDINMMNVTRGFDRTKEQFTNLLHNTGFLNVSFIHICDSHFIIEAQKS